MYTKLQAVWKGKFGNISCGIKLCRDFVEMGKIWMRKCRVASCATGLWLYVVSLCPESGIESTECCTMLLSLVPQSRFQNCRFQIQNWYNHSILKDVFPHTRQKNSKLWSFLMKCTIRRGDQYFPESTLKVDANSCAVCILTSRF